MLNAHVPRKKLKIANEILIWLLLFLRRTRKLSIKSKIPVMMIILLINPTKLLYSIEEKRGTYFFATMRLQYPKGSRISSIFSVSNPALCARLANRSASR